MVLNDSKKLTSQKRTEVFYNVISFIKENKKILSFRLDLLIVKNLVQWFVFNFTNVLIMIALFFTYLYILRRL